MTQKPAKKPQRNPQSSILPSIPWISAIEPVVCESIVQKTTPTTVYNLSSKKWSRQSSDQSLFRPKLKVTTFRTENWNKKKFNWMSQKHVTVNQHKNCFSLSLNSSRASRQTLTTKSSARQPKNTTWMMLRTFIIATLKGSIIKTNQLRKTKNTSKSTRIWLLLLNRIHRPARKWAALVRLIAINSQLNATSKIKTHTPKTQELMDFSIHC